MKKLLCLTLSILLLLSLAGCDGGIEDTNGEDDYSLATITDENIINLDIGASGSSSSTTGDSTLTKYSAQNFSGVEEIYMADYIFSSDVTINVTSMVLKEGNFRGVVLVDDEIVYDFDLEEMDQSCELHDINGTVSVRIAGESAAYEFYMEVW